MALIQVRMRFGDTEQALVDLQHMLNHIAVPRSEHDIELATIVSQRADVGGWCGLDNSGRLTIGIEQEALRDLVLVLDGAEIPCLKLRQSSGIHELRLPRHWQKTARAEVLLHGCALIGSPIDVAHITQVEGFVELEFHVGGPTRVVPVSCGAGARSRHHRRRCGRPRQTTVDPCWIGGQPFHWR